MSDSIEKMLGARAKPKEKVSKLVTAICRGEISVTSFIDYFIAASDVVKGTCADVMKHVSAERPELLAPHIGTLIEYVNYKAPRVKWGVPEAIGNMAGEFPDEAARAVPSLLKNAVESETNTTVIRWCSAYALTQIARSNRRTGKNLLPTFRKLSEGETNNGVRNLYLRAMKATESER